MSPNNQNLDKWKDFILKLLVERGDASLTNYVWEQLKQEYKPSNDNVGHSLYIECVLPCLEDEFKLICRTGKNGIHITEKGKQVQKIGFRKYINSCKRRENIQKMNDYFTFAFGICTIITGAMSFINTIVKWWANTTLSFIPTVIFAILFVASYVFKKSSSLK